MTITLINKADASELTLFEATWKKTAPYPSTSYHISGSFVAEANFCSLSSTRAVICVKLRTNDYSSWSCSSAICFSGLPLVPWMALHVKLSAASELGEVMLDKHSTMRDDIFPFEHPAPEARAAPKGTIVRAIARRDPVNGYWYPIQYEWPFWSLNGNNCQEKIHAKT